MARKPITDIDGLEDALSEPTPGVVESLGRLKGDIIVLGAGGKMGPSLARMARRASVAAGVSCRVIIEANYIDSGNLTKEQLTPIPPPVSAASSSPSR